MLTDIDINAFETPPPSLPPSLRGIRAAPTPCRLNSDIFFLPAGLTNPRQRSSIATGTVQTTTSSKQFGYSRPRLGTDASSLIKNKNLVGSFRVPNMLHTTRGTANRYSLVEDDTQSMKIIYSTYDNKQKSVQS